MRKIIQTKEALTDFYADKIKQANAIAVFKYLGLDAEDMTHLRKEMLKHDAKLHVLKNNIIIRSLQKAGFSEFAELAGANAIIISNGDAVLPLKAVKEIADKNDFVKFEGSVVDQKFMDANDTLRFAQLPSREGMYSMILSCLTAPIRGFLFGLKAIGETKTN